ASEQARQCRGKRSVRDDTSAAGSEREKGGKSGKQAIASGRVRALQCPVKRRESADPIPRWAATAQRLSPTEVYPPCPSPSGPAHCTSGTADRPLFVRPRVRSERAYGYAPDCILAIGTAVPDLAGVRVLARPHHPRAEDSALGRLGGWARLCGA